MDRIVLVGFAGSGKNTFGEILIRGHGYVGLSFADSLKDCLSSIFSWDRSLLEGVTKDSREWREEIDTWWANRLGIPDFSPRWAMRNFGTDVMRQHFHQEIWVANTEKRIHDLGDKKVVVMDGRFPNEISMVQRLGGVPVRIKRGPEPWYYDEASIGMTDDLRRRLQENNVHESEWAWIGTEIKTTIDNDSSIGDLSNKADAWIHQTSV